jgi:hypothetical protein
MAAAGRPNPERWFERRDFVPQRFPGWLLLAGLLLGSALVLGACGGGATPPTAPANPEVDSPPAVTESAPTATPAEPGTLTPAPGETEVPVSPTGEAVATNGRTSDGYFFLGRADAAVTLWDFSDFL